MALGGMCIDSIEKVSFLEILNMASYTGHLTSKS